MEPEEYSKKDVEATEVFFKEMQTIKNLGDRRIETFEKGFFDIQFVGEDKPRRGIQIHHAVVDSNAHPIYLVGPDNTNWNWSNIIRIKRVADA